MNYLAVIANAFSPTNIFLFTVMLVALHFLKIELVKHRSIDETYAQTKLVNRLILIWKCVLGVGVILVIALSGLKFYVSADQASKEEYRKNVQAHKQALIVEQAKPKLNQDVFYYCLDSSKSDKGVSPEAIKACTDAASLEVISNEHVKTYRYTSSLL